MPEIGVEHLSEDSRHEAVDEEVHGGVDDHEELRDDAPEERPHADAVAVVRHVFDELLYRENLRKEGHRQMFRKSGAFAVIFF